jgi:TorA maturation chaperone TorD
MSDRQGAASVAVHPPVAAEDLARAEFYALLARLFAAAPDPALLAAIGASDLWPANADNPFALAWNKLVLASRAMDADAAEQEYTDLFVGVGKCEVNPHASHWLSGFMMEKPLAELRSDLAELGLSRRDGVNMLEDHLAALFETMRILIAGSPQRRPAAVAVQRGFFERRIAAWAPECCAAIVQSPVANYYRCVGQFGSLFLALERDSLAIE